jgi:hypothetical protein
VAFRIDQLDPKAVMIPPQTSFQTVRKAPESSGAS